MKISKEEILHIANLADLNLEENEIRVYENTLYIYENGVYKKNEKNIHRKIIEIYPKSTIRMQKEVISYLLTIAPEAELQYDNFINFYIITSFSSITI